MKFLFIVQGEGRGHLTQALTMEERLLREGHEVVEVMVGKSRYRELPEFFRREIKAPVSRFESPNFLPTPANRKNNITSSVLYNLMRLPAFIKSVLFLRRHIKESGADVVVNFYELLTGIAYLFFRPAVRQVCIGHQYLFLHRSFRLPRVNPFQLFLLKFFTIITAIGSERKLALSFTRMPDDVQRGVYVVPPLLRCEALRQKPTAGDYVHGYMVNAGFSTQVMEWHEKRPGEKLYFFWDRKDEPVEKKVDDTLTFHTLDDKAFLESMAGCKAYASTAGFESICEAMYMGKPVLMVPAHIEQQCNAFDAMNAGAGIISDDFSLDRLLDFSKTFQPSPSFVYWANDVDLLVQRLTYVPGAEVDGTFCVESLLHLYRWVKPMLTHNY